MKIEAHYFLSRENCNSEIYVEYAKEQCIKSLKDQLFDLVKNGADISFEKLFEEEREAHCPEGIFYDYWINYSDNFWRQRLLEDEKNGKKI